MRILHVVSSVDPAMGGVAESIRSRGLKLEEMGHTIEVVSLDQKDAPFIQAYSLTVHPLGKGFTGWQYHTGIKSWIKDHARRFDAVIIDGIWQYPGIAARSALLREGIPYYVFTHGMLDPWFKRAYPMKHLKKWLFWPWAEYRLLRDAASVLFTCEEEKILARESFWLYKPTEKVSALGSVDSPIAEQDALYDLYTLHPQLRGQKYYLYLGRIHPKKGCDHLIKAFAEASRDDQDRQLVVAGPGSPDYIESLRTLAASLGVSDRIKWLGMISGNAKWGAIYASEAFVLPSHQENFGFAVVEAMACGKPVLISNKVNIWREIHQDGAGIIEPDTESGTLKLLRAWKKMPDHAKEQMGRSARQSFEKRFTVEASARALLAALGYQRAD